MTKKKTGVNISSLDLKSLGVGEMLDKSTITNNVQQQFIVTTEDKIRLSLMEVEKNKKYVADRWSYLGMALSFLVPSLTAEFKGFGIINAVFLTTVFWLLSIIFSFLTVFAFIRYCKNKKNISIKYCLDLIKGN